MKVPWSEVPERLGGRRAVSLVGYLWATPFWILGFLFNEEVTYESWGNALSVFLIATVGNVGLGLVFLLAHVSVLRDRREKPVPLWVVVGVWGLAGSTRALILVAGLTLLDIENSVPTQQRVVFSALMAIVGFGIAAYGLDAFDRFSAARAEALDILLHGEEQLSAHRAAVVSMEEALVAQVDKRLRDSQAATLGALNKLEEALASDSRTLPALQDLRDLSDATWQRISQELWNRAPTDAPRIRAKEFLELNVGSRPFRLMYMILLGLFLYVLLYNRVFDPVIGAAITGIWIAGALIVTALGNWLLPLMHRFALPTYLIVSLVLLVSSVPLLVLADSWGYTSDQPWRVFSVHAISVFVGLATSAPSTVAIARERVLSGLKRSLDSTTLEKLHVESHLKVLSHKIANRLHGDVRGNFLATILKLQDHIARGDRATAATEIQALRDILQQSRRIAPLVEDSRGDLEKFVQNWTALVDIDFDQPLSSVGETYLPAVHTIVVDAVNNAVRHGKANWVRIGFTQETDALLVTIRNNGEAKYSNRAGLGTAHLNLYAPDKWSLVRTSNGLTQLLVRLESSSLPRESALR